MCFLPNGLIPPRQSTQAVISNPCHSVTEGNSNTPSSATCSAPTATFSWANTLWVALPYYLAELIIQNNQLVAIEVPISEPPKGYNLWHFYSEIQFETSKKTNLVIAFSIDNLTNEAYRDYLNRQRFFVDEMGRNFQVQIKFNY